MTLDEIAAKVEALASPSHDIDAWIADAVGHGQLRDGYLYAWCEGGSTNSLIPAPGYTNSLDAAATLVPAGYRISTIGEWDHEILREKGVWHAVLIRVGSRDHGLPDVFGPRCQHAQTAANALTAAALRAHAALMVSI